MDDVTWKCTSIKLNVQSMPLPTVSISKLDIYIYIYSAAEYKMLKDVIG